VAVVPTMMRALLPALATEPMARALRAVREAKRLRQVLIGGEFLPAALGEGIVEAFPHGRLIDIYGLTETATSDFVLFPEKRARYGGCIGRPAPNIVVRIAAPDGQPVPAGEVGELQIRTPYLMNGYLDAPSLTAAALQDGYFRTGDLARLRDGEFVELVGRAKELIVRGGNKISPLEVEQVLARHPGVAGVLATGVSDPVLGERIHVLVVPNPGQAPSLAALRAFAAERLERYKWPDAMYLGEELPLGRTGKADRGALRAMIESGDLRAT
jgi:acyl-CoA synthetase (AMP-forming)/AMP-acid ligase II